MAKIPGEWPAINVHLQRFFLIYAYLINFIHETEVHKTTGSTRAISHALSTLEKRNNSIDFIAHDDDINVRNVNNSKSRVERRKIDNSLAGAKMQKTQCNSL